MNFYPFHIGDYISDTAHLTPMEDLVYRRLMDLYYLTEAPLKHEPAKLARLIRLKEHQEEIETILFEFFVVDEDGICRHTRCDEELEKYQHKRDSAINANKKRWGSDKVSASDKKRNTDRVLTNTNTNTNTKDKNITPLKRLESLNIDKQVAKDWIALRNKLKAPVTDTVIKSFMRKSKEANMTLEQVLILCIEKSWRGFEVDWVDKTAKNGSGGTINPHSITLPSGKVLDDWRTSDEGIKAKGKELDLRLNPEEDLRLYRKRIFNKLGVSYG